MNNPFAPPGDAHTSNGRIVPEDVYGARRHGWRLTIDVLLLVVLGVLLAPHVLLNAMLWLGYLQDIGIYDPEIGGDPAWRGRPVTVPVLIAAIATVRIVLSRGRQAMGRRLKRAYAATATAAVLTALVSLIPEPSFWWG
jgi:hypothetical protein